ncbi:MAG: putative efflux transporter, permease/ATP-binding protein, partial [Pseudomonas sp.]|nr:putative efflux transporter, permease/ATP-binding protein [Pseudomonas sp.]
MHAPLSSPQRQALHLAWRFVRPYRTRLLLALLALVVTAGITLSLGQGIRLLVDQGFMTRSPHLLNQSIGVFMGLVLALALGTFSRFYLVSWIGERCVADLRRAVFDHLLSLHPGFFEDNRSAEIQSRL